MGTHRRTDLIDRRVHVGLTQQQVAEQVDVTVTTVSNWERGAQTPLTRHRRLLAEVLRVDLAELARLIDPTTPLKIDPHAVDHWLDLYESLIAAAGAVRQVATVAVPGLLQTRAYAKYLEEHIYRPVTEEEVVTKVGLRMARQDVLRREPHPLDYQVLIHEPVLSATVGNSEIMAEQLDVLDRWFHEPNIDIRVLPHDGDSLFARGGFELIVKKDRTRPFLFITVDVDGPRYEQRRSLLATVVKMYDYLLEVALSPADSLACIRQHLRSHQ